MALPWSDVPGPGRAHGDSAPRWPRPHCRGAVLLPGPESFAGVLCELGRDLRSSHRRVHPDRHHELGARKPRRRAVARWARPDLRRRRQRSGGAASGYGNLRPGERAIQLRRRPASTARLALGGHVDGRARPGDRRRSPAGARGKGGRRCFCHGDLRSGDRTLERGTGARPGLLRRYRDIAEQRQGARLRRRGRRRLAASGCGALRISCQGELMTARDLRRLFLTVTVSLACGKPVVSVPDQREVRFPGTAAVRVSPARSGEWLLLFETLQPQLLVTSPIRSAGLLGAGPEIVRTYGAPEGIPGTRWYWCSTHPATS